MHAFTGAVHDYTYIYLLSSSSTTPSVFPVAWRRAVALSVVVASIVLLTTTCVSNGNCGGIEKVVPESHVDDYDLVRHECLELNGCHTTNTCSSRNSSTFTTTELLESILYSSASFTAVAVPVY